MGASGSRASGPTELEYGSIKFTGAELFDDGVNALCPNDVAISLYDLNIYIICEYIR